MVVALTVHHTLLLCRHLEVDAVSMHAQSFLAFPPTHQSGVGE